MYKIHIFKTWATLQLQKYQRQKSEQVVFQILGWYKKKKSVKFCLGTVPNFFSRWQPDSITAHLRAPPFPCVLSDLNHYFKNVHTIYEDILFRSSMGSLVDFDMNSTSKKHIRITCMCVIARCHLTHGESIILFFIFKTFSDLFI